MLKKVMIICLAFSFVFIGGIAFAASEQPEPPQEDQTMIQESEDVTPPADPTDLITDETKNLIEEGVELTDEALELKDKVIEEGGNGHN